MSDLTEDLPKPLIEIGGRPVLWHIMKTYSCHGVNEFILCLGYRADKIKEYFENNPVEWSVNLVDTGENTTKAERLLMIKDYIEEDNFCVSYGDDVSSIDLTNLFEFHKSHGKIATITAIHPQNPFGVIEIENRIIKEFKEKPLMKEWINGGYMVFNKKIFDYIESCDDLEKEVFEKLVVQGELCAFEHHGFWKGMNTLKDTLELKELWENGKAEWKVW